MFMIHAVLHSALYFSNINKRDEIIQIHVESYLIIYEITMKLTTPLKFQIMLNIHYKTNLIHMYECKICIGASQYEYQQCLHIFIVIKKRKLKNSKVYKLIGQLCKC